MISTKSKGKLLAGLKNFIEDAQHGKDLRGERDAFLSTEKQKKKNNIRKKKTYNSSRQ